ncbi:MAG: NADPH-dependent 2,4-dienoyl-CoA reductase/sulfur reductase-like enzyme [Rhodothermales bacterium]
MVRQRIIVIGGVAAGPAAAAEAARVDPKAEVILIEQGREVSYGACEMPYLLSGVVAEWGDLVVLTPEALAQTRGIQVMTLTRVQKVDPAARRLEVKDLVSGHTRQERYDKLILATGARPHWPDIEGLQGDRVHGFRTLAQAANLTALARESRQRWTIVGGGFTGLEVVDQLKTAGHGVTVLAGSRLLSGRIDAPTASVLRDALQAAGIAVRNTRAVGVRRGAGGAAIAIRTDDGELVGSDRVIVAAGTRPAVELARDAGLKIGPSGGITTDVHMRTSNSVIWACGDCAEVHHLVTGKPAHVPLSPNAFRTARAAGRNAARTGRQAPGRFDGTVGAFALCVAGIEIGVVGLTESAARAAGFDPVSATITHASRARRMPGRQQILVHLVVDRKSRRLLGGQLVGKEGAALRTNALVPILREGGTVSDLYDLDLVYTPAIAPSLDPLLVAAGAVLKTL